MTEEINCPFCGNLIERNALECSECGALFKEPSLPNIGFNELIPFLVIDILTLGFFSTIWFYINGKSINDLAKNKDGIKLNWLIALLVVNGGFYLFFFYHHATFLIAFSALQCLIYVALSYRVLRIIQKYTLQTYNTAIDFSPWYMVLFNVMYLVHFIETYPKRVEKTHVFFDWKSVQGITIILLLLVILFLLRFYNEIFLFYN